jgi:hypothetical protein
MMLLHKSMRDLCLTKLLGRIVADAILVTD